MKSNTDVNQSKILSQILNPDSADMWIAERYSGKVTMSGEYIVEKEPIYYPSLTKPSENNYSQDTIKDIPCWTLSALLDLFGTMSLTSDCGEWKAEVDWYEQEEGKVLWEIKHAEGCADNPIDACVEMIVELNKQNFFNDDTISK